MLWTKAPYSADLTQTAGVADDDGRFVSGFPSCNSYSQTERIMFSYRRGRPASPLAELERSRAVVVSESRRCVPAAEWVRPRSSRFRLHNHEMHFAELMAAARSGSHRAAGRLLSLVEGERRDEVLASLGPSSVLDIGITGPPGAGKSTTITPSVGAYRQRELRVAVLAVDPSSPFSGGALLGDRIRMAAHINDPDVLIRSVATRGHLGGLAAAVPAAIRLLGALGYDVILLETVGVGQSEIEIAAVADPTVVILNPGAGDAVQAAKAVLLEVADIVAVNKADREGADQTVRDLRAETRSPIVRLVAAKGDGFSDLIEAIDAHHRTDSAARRAARARAQILSLAQSRLRTHPELDRLAAAVAEGHDDPYTAAEQLLAPAPQPHCAAEEKTHDA